MNENELKEILKFWKIEFGKCLNDLDGLISPLRVVRSIVIEDIAGKKYIIDKIRFDDIENKKYIAKSIEKIDELKVDKVALYLKSINGNYIEEYNLRSYMLRDYKEGIPIKQPYYLKDAWRGEKAADFLIDLYTKTKGKQLNFKKNNLKEYFDKFNYILSKNYLKEYEELKNIIEFLNKFYLKIENLPVIITHGDYHPINIIWGIDEINAVIDWEFTALNHKIYDIANMTGCILSEGAEYIESDFLKSFLKKMFNCGLIEKVEIDILPEYILFLRYVGWLTLWYKNNDKEMIEFEVKFLKYIYNNLENIKLEFVK